MASFDSQHSRQNSIQAPSTPIVEVETPLAAVNNFSLNPQLRNAAVNAVHSTKPAKETGIEHLLEQNSQWAQAIKDQDPTFFTELAKTQRPQYLWIGCSDSRVPANQVVGLAPGEVFVHRNIANVVPRSDLNSLSCLSFALHQLEVDHVIVCGHHGCGGVAAACQGLRLGIVDNWIMHIVDVRNKYDSLLAKIPDERMQFQALCELNVLAQLCNVAQTHVVQDVWRKTGTRDHVELHGWIYGLDDGLVKPLLTLKSDSDVQMEVEAAALNVVKSYIYKGRTIRSMEASVENTPAKEPGTQ